MQLQFSVWLAPPRRDLSGTSSSLHLASFCKAAPIFVSTGRCAILQYFLCSSSGICGCNSNQKPASGNAVQAYWAPERRAHGADRGGYKRKRTAREAAQGNEVIDNSGLLR